MSRENERFINGHLGRGPYFRKLDDQSADILPGKVRDEAEMTPEMSEDSLPLNPLICAKANPFRDRSGGLSYSGWLARAVDLYKMTR